MPSLVDLVRHPPLLADSSGVDPSQLCAEGLPEALWVAHKRPGDEFHGCDSYLLGQLLADRSAGRTGPAQLIRRAGHALWRCLSASAASTSAVVDTGSDVISTPRRHTLVLTDALATSVDSTSAW